MLTAIAHARICASRGLDITASRETRIQRTYFCSCQFICFCRIWSVLDLDGLWPVRDVGHCPASFKHHAICYCCFTQTVPIGHGFAFVHLTSVGFSAARVVTIVPKYTEIVECGVFSNMKWNIILVCYYSIMDYSNGTLSFSQSEHKEKNNSKQMRD